MSTAPVIGLLTDFGLQDNYVGVMKAVIAAIAPGATVIDISHAVPPGDVLAGQRMLVSSVPYFGEGALLLAVVDPGVGTSRRPLAARSGGRLFVGPDNGLFTPWLGDGQAVELANPELRLPRVSATFHGRDIFAPAAAHLCQGVPLDRFGPAILDPVHLLPPLAAPAGDGTIVGEIVYADRFGNLITNLPAAAGLVRFRDHALAVSETYGSVASGQLLALAGSDGFVEIAVRDGSAADQLRVRPGEAVAWQA